MKTAHLTAIAAAALAIALAACLGHGLAASDGASLSYPIVDTGQTACYGDGPEIAPPAPGEPFHGQDAQYAGAQPSYRDNGDGTVTDLVTGLMWQKTPGEPVTWADAVAGADPFELAGYDDWRLPTIKELYSLILFSGVDPSGPNPDRSRLRPFLDAEVFDFEYGDATGGRIIDSQYWSSTAYLGRTGPGRAATAFGVNFADGRIKGYPAEAMGPPGRRFAKKSYVRHVRGRSGYGANDFVDNGDGTITDRATGLMWMQADSGGGKDWGEALGYAEGLEFAGHDDWRLPNAKELQGIVDYSRSPSATGSAAIDPLFRVSTITTEGGATDYPCYWTGTTHVNQGRRPGSAAAYVAFGEALGWMQTPRGERVLVDVHGAGAQRSDPKSGSASDFPYGRGPQGDVIRITNYVRCVRDAGG